MNLTPKLTDAGRGLLIKAISGAPLNFTHIKIGSGDALFDPSEGDYWYDTANRQLYIYSTGWSYALRDFSKSSSAPNDPATGSLWYDYINDRLYVYEQHWNALDPNSERTVFYGSSEPEEGSSGDYWIDTDNEKLMVHDGTSWTEHDSSRFTYGPVTPVSAVEGDFWCSSLNGRLYKYEYAWVLDSEEKIYIGLEYPDKPLTGYLFYNTTTRLLYQYVNTWVESDETIVRSPNEPESPDSGDLWYDTENYILYRYNGTDYIEQFNVEYSESWGRPGYADYLTDLIEPEMSLDIQTINKGKGYVTLTFSFDNSSVSQTFRWTETGVFAVGSDGVEVLFAYSHSGLQYNTIPANNIGRVVSSTVSVNIAVDDAETITAVIGEGNIFATQESLQGHITDYNNPHHVTKEHLGLSEVVNAAPDNMILNYTASSSLTEPQSGEKLSVTMGKLKRAVNNLIAHLKARNPHGITPSGIGAAPSSHKHSINDITDLNLTAYMSSGSGSSGGATGSVGSAATAFLYQTEGAPDKIGFYTGRERGSEYIYKTAIGQVIELGFKPSRVVIVAIAHVFSSSASAYPYRNTSGVFMIGEDAPDYKYEYTLLKNSNHGGAAITDNGFYVVEGFLNNSFLNIDGEAYMYLAWK